MQYVEDDDVAAKYTCSRCGADTASESGLLVRAAWPCAVALQRPLSVCRTMSTAFGHTVRVPGAARTSVHVLYSPQTCTPAATLPLLQWEGFMGACTPALLFRNAVNIEPAGSERQEVRAGNS